VIQHAVLFYGDFQEGTPLGIGPGGEIKSVGNDVADLNSAHLVGDGDSRRSKKRSWRNLGKSEDGRRVERLAAGDDGGRSSGSGDSIGEDGRSEAVRGGGGGAGGRHRIDQTDTMKRTILIFGVHKTALCFSYIH
jgi:hypothetical protein